MKVILIENHEDRLTPSIWAEAIAQFFASRGGRCVYIRPGITGEDETRRSLDAAMDSSGIVIVETHGETMPDRELIPDYTITIRRNTGWQMDIGRAALRARLESSLDSIDKIDNERIIKEYLKIALDTWSPEEQQRLDDALIALGWTSNRNPEGKLEWRRKNALLVQVSEET